MTPDIDIYRAATMLIMKYGRHRDHQATTLTGAVMSRRKTCKN